MYQFENQKIIMKFIYNKIEKGYTVKKISKDTYEFKIKTKTLDATEKIHSDNFLTEFLKK
jgi:hypothetical protein